MHMQVDSNNNARCVVPQNITLDILYEDQDMVVINKPSGMIMQFVSGSLENAIAFHLNNNNTDTASKSAYNTPSWPWKSQDSFEGIVHRIDKQTSGIVVVAKHPIAATALHESFKTRKVHKEYLAIAVGLPTPPTLSTPMQTATENLPLQNHLSLPTPLSKEIKQCGRNATKALELIQQSPDHLANVVCFNAALTVCKKAGQRSKALLVFDLMKKRGVTPSTKCFMKAINFCAKEPPLSDKAVELVQYMIACKLPLNPHCVSSAISACGRAGELDSVLELIHLAEERSAGFDGMIGCFKAAIVACERCGSIDSARTLKDKLRTMTMASDVIDDNSIGDVEPNHLHLQSLNKEILVDAPIGKIGSRKRVMGITSISQGGRDARSFITPIAFDGSLSLNRAVIETGRTHQIRVHMAFLGCPLAGDQMYNSNDPIKRAERCMLHATELTIPHPISGTTLRISCPPPPDFSALADSIQSASLVSIEC